MKLVIFNQDLRISDNPALFFACQKATTDGQDILPIFIFDEVNKRKLGGASKWFLHFSLEGLQKNLQKILGLNLLFFKGDSLKILSKIITQNNVAEIYFNKLYEPDNRELENKIKHLAQTKNIKIFDFKSYLIFDPNEIKNQSGSYFKVFTPFWKKCLTRWELDQQPLEIPTFLSKNLHSKMGDLNILELLPKNPNWATSFENLWDFDQEVILKNFKNFLKNNLKEYKENRDFPAHEATSKISAYLHFGLVSITEIVQLTKDHNRKNLEQKTGTAHFLSEIGWREFSHYLLYHFPTLATENFKTKFNNFPWQNNSKLLKNWQEGKTGYPIIDAAMQELWQTGFMQNRARMVVASFLIKHLLIDWKMGEKWFWDCLVDANLANNVGGWQWVAGCGADAAPYFRIFNPTIQGQKFDPKGEYVKKYLPQLKNIPSKFIHQPWKLSDLELEKYGVKLGKNYPHRIVIHEEARVVALAIYKRL